MGLWARQVPLRGVQATKCGQYCPFKIVLGVEISVAMEISCIKWVTGEISVAMEISCIKWVRGEISVETEISCIKWVQGRISIVTEISGSMFAHSELSVTILVIASCLDD